MLPENSRRGCRAPLADAGLVGVAPEVDFPHYFTGTDPVAGSVVPAGGEVAMTIGDG